MKNNLLLSITFMSVSTLFGAQNVSDNGYYVNYLHNDEERGDISELVEIESDRFSDACCMITGSLPMIVAAQKLCPLGVAYKDTQWHVYHGDKDHIIPHHDVDPLLLSLDEGGLVKFFESGCYVRVGQYTNGDFNLKACARGFGGGFWGWMAGAYGGKFITHFICHGAILVVGACTGPAAPATIAALEATFLPTIEAASTVVALAGGISGGVMTGPV